MLDVHREGVEQRVRARVVLARGEHLGLCGFLARAAHRGVLALWAGDVAVVAGRVVREVDGLLAALAGAVVLGHDASRRAAGLPPSITGGPGHWRGTSGVDG